MTKRRSEVHTSSPLEGLASRFSFSLEMEDTLRRVCQAAVDVFGVNHSGLVLFDSKLEQGRVEAEYPLWNLVGRTIPLQDIPDEVTLIRTKAPLMIANVEGRKSLGPVRDWLVSKKISSLLIVPVIGKERILGSFSLDVSDKLRKFTKSEVESCKVFAERVADAIENAQLFERTKRQASQLEALRNTTVAISSIADRRSLLEEIVKQAARLLDARGGGIYEYSSELEELTIIADSRRPSNLGRTLKRGEGLAGYLVQSGRPFMIVDNYNAWSRTVGSRKARSSSGPVIQVPLRWQKKTIGVLYVNDKVSRRFSTEDAYWLGLFADQAAIALVNTGLLASNKHKVNRLEKLSRAITEIMNSIGRTGLEKLLTQVAKHAVNILEAEACGVHFVRRPGFLTLEASYGHRKGSFKKGKDFAITSGPHSGLTGHIAYEGKIFNSYGTSLTTHYAVRTTKHSHLPSGSCYSLLAIPLRKNFHGEEKLLGLLRIENKKRNGKPSLAYGFSKEDEWILSIFAEAVVVAIQSAELLNQLNRQALHLKRLFTSVPDCIIAIDAKGNVTDYNQRAQDILGYRPKEVLNKHVKRLYQDPDEARKVGELLSQVPDGRLSNYETLIQAKNGEIIPIRLSATWLYNAQQQRIGSVGFFEDLRTTEEYEAATRRARNLNAVLRVSRAVNSSLDLDSLLALACKSVVELLKVDHSALALFDGDYSQGEIKAEYPETGTRGTIIPVRGVPLEEKLIVRKRVIAINDVENELALDPARDVLTSVNTKSVMLVPILNRKNRVIGSFGLDVWDRTHEFTQEEKDLCRIFAAQVAPAIENAQRTHYLTAVLQVSEMANSSADLDRILGEACRAAVQSLAVDHAGLALFDRNLKKGTVRAEFPDAGMIGEIFNLRGVPLEEQLINTRQPLVISDVSREPGLDGVREILSKLGTQSLMFVPVLSKGRVLGSFGLDSLKHRRVFTDEEIELARVLAEQSAMAIEAERRYQDLRTIKALVGTRTATDWMRMVSTAWGHAIKRESGLALRYLELAFQGVESGETGQLLTDLTKLKSVVERIRELPIVAPLGREDKSMRIYINDLIKRHVDKMWKHEPYRTVGLDWDLQKEMDRNVAVKASPQWVLRCLEILVENAVAAILEAPSSRGRVAISTRVDGENEVQIVVRDNGPGFPREIERDRIGIEPIEKPEGSVGAGLGLVLAKTIAQSYGGDLKMIKSGPRGTAMSIYLPCKKLA